MVVEVLSATLLSPGEGAAQVASVALAQESWIWVPWEGSVGRDWRGWVSERVALKTLLAGAK